MDLKQLHERAMLHADLAGIARAKGQEAESLQHFRAAFDFESKAAGVLASEISVEPTRAILHRGAATLALQCGFHREAERLVASGLAGDPPEDLAEELRDVYEQANFLRHLTAKGKSLSRHELRIALSGAAIGHGIAPESEFTKRIATTKKLVLRTLARLDEKEFESRLKVAKDKAEVFIQVPEAASFAAVLRFGSAQLPLPQFDDLNRQALIELTECLTLYNNGQEEQLANRICDDNYFVNFTSLAKDLSPDGKRVRQVGITVAGRSEIPLTVSITRVPSKASAASAPAKERPSTLTWRGRLMQADGWEDCVRIEDESGKPSRKIHVPEGLEDVVRSRFMDEVEVTCDRKGNKLVLRDVTSIDEAGSSNE